MRRLALLGCTAVATLGLAPAAGAARSPQALLARFQPVLVLERTELYRPAPVGPFVAGSDLQQRDPGGAWTSVGPAGVLPVTDPPGCSSADGPCYRLDVRACSAQLGFASLGCYAPLVTGDPMLPNTIHGRAVRFGKRTVLQYWLFYPYNLWSAQYPPTSFVWRSHEGDWEQVTIVLSTAGQEPLYAGYSQHCNGRRRQWAKVRKWRRTQHPLVYVGLGSHANYFTPGAHAHDRSCYPEAALIVFDANRIVPTDFTGGGALLGPRGAAGVLPVALARVRADRPAWMTFPGAWGETGYFRAPGIETVAFGLGPEGPAFHESWRRPLATVSKWRPG
jgi:hypothetical protein